MGIKSLKMALRQMRIPNTYTVPVEVAMMTEHVNRINLLVDVNLVLYSGKIEKNRLLDGGEYEPLAVARTAVCVIESIVGELFGLLKKYQTLNVKLYFDGQRPGAKYHTSYQRNRFDLDTKSALAWVKSLISEFLPSAQVVQLLEGEAEMACVEMARHSSGVDEINIIFSDDTDVIVSGYGLKNCYFMQRWKTEECISLGSLAEQIGAAPILFRIICFCAGSDFTPPVLTLSMVTRLLELSTEVPDDALKDGRVYFSDVVQILYDIVSTIAFNAQGIRWPQRTAPQYNSTKNFVDYIEALVWSCNYSSGIKVPYLVNYPCICIDVDPRGFLSWVADGAQCWKSTRYVQEKKSTSEFTHELISKIRENCIHL